MSEAYIICLDNSEWMRNGDYSPSRFFSQNDAATLISSMKLDTNRESGVGIISMAGKTPNLLVSLTSEQGEILKALASIQIQGQISLVKTLQSAQLSLRHRKNKSQKARICLFIGSPIKADKKEIKAIAKALRRDGIALDIFSFGEVEENEAILTELHKLVKNNSNYLAILPNTFVLADAVMNSIYGSGLASGGGDGAANGGGMSNQFEEYGGVDPNIDPELAMVMQMSIQESLRNAESENNNNNNASNNQDNNQDNNNNQEKMEVDPDLNLAIQMSQGNDNNNNNNNNNNNQEAPRELNVEKSEVNDAMEEDDEDEIRQAMALSLLTGSSVEPAEEKKEEKKEDLVSEAMNDPNFLGSLMESFPGLDPNDPLIKDALNQLKGKDEEKKE